MMRSRKAIEKDADHNAKGAVDNETRVHVGAYGNGPLVYIAALIQNVLEVALDIRDLLAEKKS